jgi:hypothetical protein
MTHYNSLTWTADQVGFLLGQWNGGASAADIARCLHTTRNAILGKIHRLRKYGVITRPREFTGRIATVRPKKRKKPASRPLTAAKQRPRSQRSGKAPAAPRLVLAGAAHTPRKPMTIGQLEPAHCRYICDEPSADALYCGDHVEGDGSWCAHHRALVFSTPEPTKRKTTTTGDKLKFAERVLAGGIR